MWVDTSPQEKLDPQPAQGVAEAPASTEPLQKHKSQKSTEEIYTSASVSRLNDSINEEGSAMRLRDSSASIIEVDS